MKSLGFLRISFIFVGLGVILMIVSLLPLFTFLPSCSFWQMRTNAANGERQLVEIGFLVSDSFVRIDVLVSGGDDSITISLMDSSTNVLEGSVVDIFGSITLDVPKNDVYLLSLKNDHSPLLTNDKDIIVKVYYYFYNYILAFSGGIMLVSGSLFALYSGLVERKKVPPN